LGATALDHLGVGARQLQFHHRRPEQRLHLQEIVFLDAFLGRHLRRYGGDGVVLVGRQREARFGAGDAVVVQGTVFEAQGAAWRGGRLAPQADLRRSVSDQRELPLGDRRATDAHIGG